MLNRCIIEKYDQQKFVITIYLKVLMAKFSKCQKQ